MINHSYHENLQLIWQVIWWRLVLTALLLAILAGSSASIFSRVTTNANSQTLPNFTYDTGIINRDAGAQQQSISIP